VTTGSEYGGRDRPEEGPVDLRVVIRVVVADDVDEEELYDLTSDLEAELQDTHARSVTHSRHDEAVVGAKSSGAVSVGQLLLVTAPAALPGVIALIGSWLNRHRDQRIRVKLGEVEVDVPRDASSEEVRSLVAIVTDAAAKNPDVTSESNDVGVRSDDGDAPEE
jgi:hypothetical protein